MGEATLPQHLFLFGMGIGSNMIGTHNRRHHRRRHLRRRCRRLWTLDGFGQVWTARDTAQL